MEKKHRDIVVDGQPYGWTLYNKGKENFVEVWKNKKSYFTKMFRQDSVTPADIAEAIKEFNENLRQVELMETISKEWTAFLDTIPWNTGYSIPESNRIFEGKRKNWMKRMVKKHGVEMQVLEERYVHD
jgi:hypothetical protein